MPEEGGEGNEQKLPERSGFIGFEKDFPLNQKIAACGSSYILHSCRSCRRLRSFDL